MKDKQRICLFFYHRRVMKDIDQHKNENLHENL